MNPGVMFIIGWAIGAATVAGVWVETRREG